MVKDPRIPDWERKSAEGTLTEEDVRAYVELLRAGRNSAFAPKSKKAKINLDEPVKLENVSEDDK